MLHPKGTYLCLTDGDIYFLVNTKSGRHSGGSRPTIRLTKKRLHGSVKNLPFTWKIELPVEFIKGG